MAFAAIVATGVKLTRVGVRACMPIPTNLTRGTTIPTLLVRNWHTSTSYQHIGPSLRGDSPQIDIQNVPRSLSIPNIWLGDRFFYTSKLRVSRVVTKNMKQQQLEHHVNGHCREILQMMEKGGMCCQHHLEVIYRLHPKQPGQDTFH